MTTATPAPSDLALPSAASVRRLQGLAVIVGLALAVLGTVVLVMPANRATASSSSGSGRSSASSASSASVSLVGTKVAIQSGDPYVAYGLADSLAGRGASMGAVSPASDRSSIPSATVIEYYDRSKLATAERIRAVLGEGTLRRRQVFEPGVDVTIVLGKDLAEP